MRQPLPRMLAGHVVIALWALCAARVAMIREPRYLEADDDATSIRGDARRGRVGGRDYFPKLHPGAKRLCLVASPPGGNAGGADAHAPALGGLSRCFIVCGQPLCRGRYCGAVGILLAVGITVT